EGRALEAELAQLTGARHGLGVGSGTDALRLALSALGVGRGDEVLTPAFSFVASATTIAMTGATPVFVDVEQDTLTMDPAAAARVDVAGRVRRLGHHGDTGRYHHVEVGYCSRLDEVQAAWLRVKLRHLGEWTERRRAIAARYRAGLAGLPLTLPVERPGARHVYHLFTVRHAQRDALAKRLADAGVGTAVHYPRAVPDQPVFAADGERRWPEAYRAAREVLSLPCYPEMTDDEVEGVVDAVRTACEELG